MRTINTILLWIVAARLLNAAPPVQYRLDLFTNPITRSFNETVPMVLDKDGNLLLAARIQSGSNALSVPSPGTWIPPVRPDGNGALDAVARVSTRGDRILFATFAPGTPSALAVGPDNSTYIAGSLTSPLPIPNEEGPFPCAGGSGSGGGAVTNYILKLSPAGDRSIYNTCFRSNDTIVGLAIDADGSAVIGGTRANDAYVLKLNPQRTAFAFNRAVGGTGQDRAFALAIDRSGSIYLAGSTTEGEGVPTTPGAAQVASGGGSFRRTSDAGKSRPVSPPPASPCLWIPSTPTCEPPKAHSC
jgi:hypothetical protein